nr:hypothetical protein B0A51_04288 [Rachicladosporium sp. CCFEE 5018]
MTSSLVEVCNILIGHTFDDICQRIFTKLANGGRTTFNLLKSLHFRDTAPRRLKQSLARLIQHRLVLHYTENADTDAERTYYSVDWHVAYGWIPHGRLVALVQDRHGDKAGSLIAMLLQVGHTTVADLASAFNFEEASGSKRDSGTDINAAPHVNGNGAANGAHAHREKDNGSIKSIEELHYILRKLLHAGILQKVGTHTFKPHADAEAETQAVVMEEQFPDGKITGPRKQAEFKRSVDSLKRKWRDEEQYDEHRDADTNGTIKRPGQDAILANKRRKMNGGSTNGHGEVQADFSGPKLPNDMSIGINHARCTVALRSEQLVHHAKQYLGHTTAGVYRALLISLEKKIRSIRDDTMVYEDEDDEDEAQPVASVMEVADQLDPNLDLTPPSKANKAATTNGGPKVKKKGTIEYDPEFADIGIKREVASDSDDDITPIKAQGRRLDTIEQHLKLLEEHISQFCHRPSVTGSSEWRVSFPFITRTLIQAQLDTTIQRRFGTVGVRVARMLREEGKLEEKQVAQRVLKHVKDIRSTLGLMQAAGLLETQELPRDQYRQPTKCIYLWYFDEKKVQAQVLAQSYQGIARCLQRMDVEQTRFQQVLDKRARLRADSGEDEQRTFMMGKAGLLEEEGAPLSGVEKLQLGQWREVQEKLLAQVGRLDELVALMRDFDGGDVSMIC